MSLFQRQIDFNKMVRELPFTPIIVNDLNMVTEEDQKLVEELIVTTFNGDKVTLLPTCQCGKTKGVFSKVTHCDVCHTEVKSQMTSDVFSDLWFRAPKGVDTLIVPHYWIRIKDLLSRPRFCLMTYLTNTAYMPSDKNPEIIGLLIRAGITKRGLNYFTQNLYGILEAVAAMPRFKTKQEAIYELLADMRNNPEKVFSQYIPLPNKSMMVIESNNLGIYIDKWVLDAKSAIKMMVGIDKNVFVKNIENRTSKSMDALAAVYYLYIEQNLKPKTGLLRKHTGPTRTVFSCRNVLISETGPHHYEDLSIPWCSATVTFSTLIMNKLLKRGYSLNQAKGLLTTHLHQYHKDIDQCFDEILEESKQSDVNGMTNVVGRNPSMLVGSTQTKKLTKIYRDPLNRAIGTSILSVKAMNADHDGDFVTVVFCMDKQMAEVVQPLRLETSVYAFNKPYQVAGLMALPKPNVASAANWLSMG